MGSLFFVSVQETPGTEVVDYRDSTYYSVAEYSWAPTEKMYWEDAFVCHSVWSNNEDDVSPGNKPRDMMVLDKLADNIISDEFPDEDK